MTTLKKMKEIYSSQDNTQLYREVYAFSSIGRFLDFCKKENLTPDNSETQYDVERDCMYIRRLL